MSVITWLSAPEAILASPLVQRDAALQSFCRLLLDHPRPLVGAMSLLLEDTVLHFGHADEASARHLGGVHAEVALEAVPASMPDTPQAAGLDPTRPDLGLVVERDRRHPLAAARDRRPGEWVHPVLKVHRRDFFVRLLAQRNLGLGEAFLAGEFEMLRGSVHHFVSFFLVNRIDRHLQLSAGEQAKLVWQYAKWRASHSHNEDIADHYDIGDNIMVPMLGATGCYSCGYMEHEDDDLDRMQVAKMNLIFSKMRLRPGMRVLDTGCGNGGMLVHAATAWGCEGEGFTNSYNMASLARRNAESNGVADRVRVHHADFGLLKSLPDAHFDAVYEVGAWEHLPFDQYGEVMRQCHRILKPGGRMLIHSMGSHTKVHLRDAYIQKYVFRDSNQLRLHAVLDEARQHDLYVADVENLGRHYYWTLWYWRRNLIDAYERDQGISDRDFRVMLYFLECGMGESRFGDGSVYHLLLYKDARDHLATWRVDGRMHEAGRGAVRAQPFVMKPCNTNEHLHNHAAVAGKLDQPVYRRPGALTRLAQWLGTVRQVRHQ